MSAEVQAVVKVESRLDSPVKRQRSVNVQANLTTKKPKTEDGKFKFGKKRSQTFSGGKMFPPYKKRKKEVHIPPTKFLLGGNIRDPLNLNSFQDEEINRAMNAVTPESSPLPTPQHRKGEIEVIIPANIRDPLNLAGGEEDNDAYAASFLTTPAKRLKKKNKKKRQRSSTGSGKEDNADFKSDESKSDDLIEQDLKKPEEIVAPPEEPPIEEIKPVEVEVKPVEVPVKPAVLELPIKDVKKPKFPEKESPAEKDKGKQQRKMFDTKDKIVSPVIPQPGAWVERHSRFKKQSQRPAQNTPNFKEKNTKFQYGNYNRYYGYRNPGQEVDPRLKLLSRMSSVFLGKDVLDIGCNTGHLTLSVARDFGARKVVGLDIDRSLIDIARANVRKRYWTETKSFPLSMPLVYGSLEVPGISSSNLFPHNVSFIQGNYVLDNDVLLDLEQPQFDVILCLSVTKWLHLNWGDDGLKRAFSRMFTQLRPGGVLILEPQSWYSYKKKKNITEAMWKNYSNIKLLPTMFTEFLLSEVGFSKCEVIGAPYHSVKAFQRPIKVFTKSNVAKTPLPTTTETKPVSTTEISVSQTPMIVVESEAVVDTKMTYPTETESAESRASTTRVVDSEKVADTKMTSPAQTLTTESQSSTMGVECEVVADTKTTYPTAESQKSTVVVESEVVVDTKITAPIETETVESQISSVVESETDTKMTSPTEKDSR